MESKNLIYLVTEYADNGELLDLLLREKRLSEAKAKEKFRQLLLAVEYIHSKNIVNTPLSVHFSPSRCLSLSSHSRSIVSSCCSKASRVRFIFSSGDLKAENLLLDAQGNIKVAGEIDIVNREKNRPNE